MKTALYITTCTDEPTRALQEYWLATEEPLRLTVVHPYTLDSNQLITKEAVRTAKQQAESRLRQWTAELLNDQPGNLQTETLLADPDLALQLHLIIRKYDYLLIADQHTVLPPALLAIVNQTQTLMRVLSDKTDASEETKPYVGYEDPGSVPIHEPVAFAAAF
ncbi:hypothetical protein BN8_01655 [Fibrisoma limi BUZ 3]|uniref:UspA domain-containing protein n=1 Tax=Fibrisoma limi BUZ 3 TaxID=1185876 RepID=I2GFG6_9BACT|nr:hypothetical protein [Fibrisoma limi]CCH52641.1 hypothetical protein BN8_01655 [Fibrisoma limi BUZ 3]